MYLKEFYKYIFLFIKYDYFIFLWGLIIIDNFIEIGMNEIYII